MIEKNFRPYMNFYMVRTNSLKIIFFRMNYLKPRTLTKIVFGTYVLFAIHLPIPHIGGTGLYLPFNIIAWIFISFIIGLGSYQIFISKKFHFSQFNMLLQPFLFISYLGVNLCNSCNSCNSSFHLSNLSKSNGY